MRPDAGLRIYNAETRGKKQEGEGERGVKKAL